MGLHRSSWRGVVARLRPASSANQHDAGRVYDVETWQALSVTSFGDRYGLASYDVTWTPHGDVVVRDWGGKVASLSFPDDGPRDRE